MKHFALSVIVAGLLLVGLVSLKAGQDGQQRGQISGFGAADGKPIRNATARLREFESGQLTASTACDSSGIFAFVGVPAGTYVVELVCNGGALLGASSPVSLKPGAMATHSVAVDISEPAARTAGAAACLGSTSKMAGLFDVTRRPFMSALGLTVVAAAGASGVAAVVATKDDASGSR
jgi:hypothetical protein